MFDSLPQTSDAIRDWGWEQLEPYIKNLQERELTADSISQWLLDWTAISELIWENMSRARVATTLDTRDEEAENYLKHLLDNVMPPIQVANNQLNLKLLESGLIPDGMEVPIKGLRADVELFREENIPLATQDQKLGMDYARITGAQTVEIDGEEKTLTQLNPYFFEKDRDLREKVWQMSRERWLQDREAINAIWPELIEVRQQMAVNADHTDYRSYRWQQFNRFDYIPDDCFTFHNAIEEVVVPAAVRIYEKRKAQLGVDALRPWDLQVDPLGREPLKPYADIEDFKKKALGVFNRVDPKAGHYFATMMEEDLMDLENRKGKGPGAYCTTFAKSKRPFIFGNSVGVDGDVRTLLHESGHAFHSFEASQLPYMHQRSYPIEFAEVASMAMELLASPYLSGNNGDSFYSEEHAQISRIQHLEKIVLFWPYMAVVDAFQHWAYTNPEDAKNTDNCDATWAELWGRFMKGVDWNGYEDFMMTGWHRKQHIFRYAFYYVEYGLAQLGAVQVWNNALKDQAKAVESYFNGLSLGMTVPLPQLFEAAGAKFAFDSATMKTAIDLIESTISELES